MANGISVETRRAPFRHELGPPALDRVRLGTQAGPVCVNELKLLNMKDLTKKRHLRFVLGTDTDQRVLETDSIFAKRI